MSKPSIEVWFEFASTYSHVAVQRVEALAVASGAELEWRPFLLGPIFKSQGWDDSPFNIYPSKGAYMWRDMQRLCDKYQIPFKRPSAFPRNGLLAARVATAGAGEDWNARFIRAVYLANFGHDLDISEEPLVQRLLETVGCADARATIERANSADNKLLLRRRTEDAMTRGMFGAPSFVVGDELFWGNDRLEDAVAWALRPFTS
jgi:2-hydroxychromene-2-carboxylate isomerase